MPEQKSDFDEIAEEVVKEYFKRITARAETALRSALERREK